MIPFRIYYGDGSIYEGDGSWESVLATPTRNVQIIVYKNPDNDAGRSLCYPTSNDLRESFYWWREGHWFCSDYTGWIDYMMIPGIPKYTIFGRTMAENKAFRAVKDLAIEYRFDDT